ncbi:MAG: TonB-dependent receptor, partial [Halioglobus sp.]|nr:TonB-dependent receptor [Halioglobus sp.]
VIDELDAGLTNRTNVTFNLGAYCGDFFAMLTTNYKDGFDTGTSSVDSFVATNLFFSYSLPVGERLESAQVTLNIDNVMDENPSYVNDFDGINTGHSFSVGRMFTLGLRLKL